MVAGLQLSRNFLKFLKIRNLVDYDDDFWKVLMMKISTYQISVKLPASGQYKSNSRAQDQVFFKSFIIKMFARSVSLTGFEDWKTPSCSRSNATVRPSLLTVIDR